MDGDTALVSAADGAYVLERSGDTWHEQAKLVPPGPPSGPVALSGDTAVLLTQWGAVLSFFVRTDDAWTRRQDLALSRTLEVLALSGDTLLVGYPLRAIARDEGGIWREQEALSVPENSGDCFACAVALSGETALVGAPYYPYSPSPGMFDVGTASVYRRTGGGWSELSLGTPLSTRHARFGTAVAASDDTLLVGAIGAHAATPIGALTDVRTFSGAVVVFEPGVEGWEQRQQLTPRAPSQGANFGEAIALSGARALIRATAKELVAGALVTRATIHHFAASDGTWAERSELSSGELESDAGFGAAMALSGSTALVSAPGDDSVRGSVLVYRLDQPGCGGTP